MNERADLRWGTTGALLTDRATITPDAEAIVDGDLRLTWSQLNLEVWAAARGFVALGVEHGDRVAIWAPNCSGWVVAALGLQRVGAVLVPLNTRFLGSEAIYVLARSQARVLVTVKGFLGKDYPALLAEAGGGPTDGRPVKELPDLTHIVDLELDGPATAGTLGWSAMLDNTSPEPSVDELRRRVAAVTAEDLSDVLFTSGTTGQPKGAMCTHGQTLRAYQVWCDVVGLHEGDRYLVVNPFFHGFGYKAGWLACLLTGAVIVPEQTLDVPHLLDIVAAEKITVLPGTPTLYQTMLEHPEFTADGVASLRLAVTGAATVPAALLERIRDEIGFSHIVTGYGLTESCAIVSMCTWSDPVSVITTTAGRPLPGLEVRTVSPTGEDADEGEIIVRGYTVMRGYLDDPAATAATIDAEGWLHTGDIGIIDAEGRIKITDRIKDMFIVGGFNAYPAEIEQIMSGHPGIAQIAVIGVPDERMGEVGTAFVIPRRDVSLDAAELTAWAREQMANYKVPRQFVMMTEFPLTASGKVRKDELRALAAVN